MQVAEMVGCQGASLMTIEIHGNVVERLCYMTARDVMDRQPGSPFNVYILNMTAYSVNVPW